MMTTSGLQEVALVIVVLFPAIATVAVVLRVYSRISSSLFGWGKCWMRSHVTLEHIDQV